MTQFEQGDRVVILSTPEPAYFFDAGNVAILKRFDGEDWWGEFANRQEWCLQTSVGTTFKLLNDK